ncbi:isoprenoid synthase domain-containing protein [Stachybotrys elegans]|uniref:Terpene synthase n=1 Tax=Stachybotrys elegans TaxID=80388 RepID=A0A8K0SVD0_9HYPO|nr:isoprenoid synthase domain-containing protein [Stachybotrys elegans]
MASESSTVVSGYDSPRSHSSACSHDTPSSCDLQVEEHDTSPDGVSIRLPDMFSSIMSVEPIVNQHYSSVKAETDTWIAEVFNLSAEQARKSSQADFAYMNAIWAPYANKEALTVMVNWHQWFDEGHLRNDPVEAAKDIIYTLALLDDTHPYVSAEENPLRHVFQTTWYQIRKIRYKKRVRQYALAVLGQVGVKHDSRTIGVEEYMDLRRGSIGTYPSFSLVEYAHNIQIPQDILNHESIKTCEEVSSDLVILVNDLLSYRKDIEQGVDHNILTVLKYQGYTLQEAVDIVDQMIRGCYKKWYGALAELPIWGEKIDRQVLKYIEGCRNIALGNLHWSYASGRYLGSEGPQVRETRVLHLPLRSDLQY